MPCVMQRAAQLGSHLAPPPDEPTRDTGGYKGRAARDKGRDTGRPARYTGRDTGRAARDTGQSACREAGAAFVAPREATAAG